MAELQPCTFSSWKMSDEETLQASVLSPLQEQLIQNDMAQIAETILALEYDPSNPVKFAQDDAHQKGQLAAYRFLLTRSEESKIQLRNFQSRN